MNIEDLLAVNEIDRLKEKNKFLWKTDEEIYQEAEDNIRASIANSGTSCHWCEDVIRKKAIKEFAEGLKRYLYNRYNSEDISYEEFCKANVIFGDIDELLKDYEK